MEIPTTYPVTLADNEGREYQVHNASAFVTSIYSLGHKLVHRHAPAAPPAAPAAAVPAPAPAPAKPEPAARPDAPASKGA